MRGHLFQVTLFVFVIFLAGCHSKYDPEVRWQRLSEIAFEKEMLLKAEESLGYQIQTGQRIVKGGKLAYVFIEGDGLSWLTPYQISPNPTPTFPVAATFVRPTLQYHQFYLSRPCQYLLNQNPLCHRGMWTSAVYSELQRNILNEILNQWKKRYDIKTFRLVGYSGGGVLALLIAIIRQDVDHVITVASNIDVDAWVHDQDISPLRQSLNPRQQLSQLCGRTYSFFWGGKDRVVPAHTHMNFVKGLSQCAKMRTKIIASYAHDSEWSEVIVPFISAL